MTATEKALREALESLRNEIVGQLGIAREEIREAISTTNLRCLERRIDQADAALAAPVVEPEKEYAAIWVSLHGAGCKSFSDEKSARDFADSVPSKKMIIQSRTKAGPWERIL